MVAVAGITFFFQGTIVFSPLGISYESKRLFLKYYSKLFCIPPVNSVMLFSFLVCASLIYVSRLHSRIMLRKDMECHQWYNPKRNQVSWKIKKRFCKRGAGREGKKKLSTQYLQYFLEKSFTKLFHSNPTGIFPLYWATFVTCETRAFGVPCPVLVFPRERSLQGKH